VESELVVDSAHSLQDRPETVEEVRRILLYHARDVPWPRAGGPPRV